MSNALSEMEQRVTTPCAWCGNVVAVPLDTFNVRSRGTCGDAGAACRAKLDEEKLLQLIATTRARLRELEREHGTLSKR